MTKLSSASSVFEPVVYKLQAAGEVDVAVQRGTGSGGNSSF